MTAPDASVAERYIWLSIRSAICFPCMSCQPMLVIGLQSAVLPPTSSMQPEAASGLLRRSGLHRRNSSRCGRSGRHQLHIVKPPEAKGGFVLRPGRWVVERSFASAARCRHPVIDTSAMPQRSQISSSSPSPDTCSSMPKTDETRITPSSRTAIPADNGQTKYRSQNRNKSVR